MLKAWLVNDTLDSIHVEEKYLKILEETRWHCRSILGLFFGKSTDPSAKTSQGKQERQVRHCHLVSARENIWYFSRSSSFRERPCEGCLC